MNIERLAGQEFEDATILLGAKTYHNHALIHFGLVDDIASGKMAIIAERDHFVPPVHEYLHRHTHEELESSGVKYKRLFCDGFLSLEGKHEACDRREAQAISDSFICDIEFSLTGSVSANTLFRPQVEYWLTNEGHRSTLSIDKGLKEVELDQANLAHALAHEQLEEWGITLKNCPGYLTNDYMVKSCQTGEVQPLSVRLTAGRYEGTIRELWSLRMIGVNNPPGVKIDTRVCDQVFSDYPTQQEAYEQTLQLPVFKNIEVVELAGIS